MDSELKSSARNLKVQVDCLQIKYHWLWFVSSEFDVTVTILHGTGTIHVWKSWKVLNALDSNYWLGMCLIWLSNKFTCTKPVSKVTKSLIYIYIYNIYIMYIHTHKTYRLYIQFVTTWSDIVSKWQTTDRWYPSWNKSRNCHQAARSRWKFESG